MRSSAILLAGVALAAMTAWAAAASASHAAAVESSLSFRGHELSASARGSPGQQMAAEGGRIMDLYTFVSPAIWMGIVVVLLIAGIVIPGILCTMAIQGPTQFEKKPLLNSAS